MWQLSGRCWWEVNMARYVKLFFVVLFLVGKIFTVSLAAAEPKVIAELDRYSVELGSFVELLLIVEGSQSASPVKLPEIDGLQSRYVGPSMSFSMINGQTSSSKTFRYNLYPSKTGRKEIPALTVMIDGKEYKTEPLYLDVVDANNPPSPNPGGNQTTTTLADRVFLTFGLPQKDYYLGEAIPVTVKLYILNMPARVHDYPTFAHTGFEVDEFVANRQTQETVGGKAYRVVEFPTTVYPTRTGTLTLGPAQLECELILQKPAVHTGDPFGMFGDDSFIQQFFGQLDGRTVPLASSTEIKVNVQPLPEDGKPRDFSGAVGQFNFKVQAGPAAVKVGDPVTLKMSVSGNGHLNAIKLPSLSGSEKFKVYDPVWHEEKGEKSQEQIVIPLDDTVTEIPALSFSYFDPTRQKYQTVVQGPFPVTVTKVAGGDAPKALGLAASSPAVTVPVEEKLGQDIEFIKDDPGSLRPMGQRLLKRPAFWGCVVFYLLLWAGLCLWYYVRRRLLTDRRWARRRRASKEARDGLRLAHQHLERGQQQEFYDVLFKTVQGYLADRFHVPAGTIPVAAIKNLGAAQPEVDRVLENLTTIFAECELVRYAALPVDKKRMQAVCQQVEETIDIIERKW